MILRLFDGLFIWLASAIFGAMTWFVGAMVFGNVLGLLSNLNAAIILYTWGLGMLTCLLGMVSLAGVSIGFAALIGRLRLP